MRIGLIDVDSHNFPNLALMKISAYHKARRDHVDWWNGFEYYDVVYKSRVFDDTYTTDDNTVIHADTVICGGTGYDLANKLPDHIEHRYPDYSLYPAHPEAYGFLTRGCPNNCSFCIVSKKEGRSSRQVSDLFEFWCERREIKLLDPNLLACKDHENLLKQLADSGAWVDFTQGLDIRLVTSDNIPLLNRIKTKALHFAWDFPNEDLTEHFRRFRRLTSITKHRNPGVYVLTNYGSTMEQDLYRVYTLRDLGYDPYIMIYNKPHAPKQVRYLQRWVNNKRIFKTISRFEDYDHRIG